MNVINIVCTSLFNCAVLRLSILYHVMFKLTNHIGLHQVIQSFINLSINYLSFAHFILLAYLNRLY